MTELFKALKIEKNEEHQEINLVEISEDDLMEGNVVVDVTHSTLNYKDGLAMTGSSPIVRNFPMIPGIDFSGVVRSSEDSEFSKGDRVVLNGYGLSESHYGGYSERARVNSKHLLKLPENISNHQAMQIGTAGYTAMLCVLGLEDFGITPKSGEILVTGASGGVGMATIELAKAMGAKVIAGVSSENKMKFPKQVGADIVLTYGRTKKTFRLFKTQVQQACKQLGHPEGVDLVVDMVQGELFESALVSVTRPLGTICLVGFTAGQRRE